jgi:hypothetical protein
MSPTLRPCDIGFGAEVPTMPEGCTVDFASKCSFVWMLTVAASLQGCFRDTGLLVSNCGLKIDRVAAATACANGGYLFCDGFEDSMAGQFPRWDDAKIKNPVPGTELVATGRDVPVCHGAQSLVARGAGPDQTAYLTKMIALPTLVYLRTFLRVPSDSEMMFVDLISINSHSDDSIALRFDTSLSQMRIVRNSGDGSVDPTIWEPITTTLRPDRWTCVEWMLRSDPTDGELRLEMDGEPVADFKQARTAPTSDPWSVVDLGVNVTSEKQTGTSTFYLDEFVISDHPIGCD